MEEMPTVPANDWPPSLIEVTASLVAIMGVMAIIWSATVDQSASASTALTGVVGASSGYLFSKGMQGRSPSNGNGNGSTSSQNP